MPVSSKSRAVARIACVLSLALCAGGTAQSSPLMRFAALTTTVAPPAISQGPFGLAVSKNIYSARWENLQPLLRIEAKIVEMCRANADGCPAAAATFLRLVDAAKGLDGRARIGAINRAVNLAIRPQSDGVSDFWASPLTTLASGAGDCEDYAIAKYAALREAGVPSADLRLVVVRDHDSGDDHAVVAARVEGEWLILDNRHMRLVADK
ncbi:MAG: transglutaminase-like cysteine peptidase, partial [Pseudolabrys sp.]|nr:transglutaminase-like cysteine peptidase [Pseudolabrys sp.]